MAVAAQGDPAMAMCHFFLLILGAVNTFSWYCNYNGKPYDISMKDR